MSALRIASAIVAIVGLIIFGAGVVFLRTRLTQLHTWRSVEAQVTRAWMSEERGDDSTSYSANYELTYVVDGRAMQATAQTQDPLLGGAAAVRPRLARHPAGTRGVILVNPNDPSKIALNRGINGVTLGLPLWLLLAGVFFLMLALSLWLLGTPGTVW